MFSIHQKFIIADGYAKHITSGRAFWPVVTFYNELLFRQVRVFQAPLFPKRKLIRNLGPKDNATLLILPKAHLLQAWKVLLVIALRPFQHYKVIWLRGGQLRPYLSVPTEDESDWEGHNNPAETQRYSFKSGIELLTFSCRRRVYPLHYRHWWARKEVNILLLHRILRRHLPQALRLN